MFVAHPAIGTGGVEINVGAKIAEHQRFPEIARAEVGDHKWNLRITQSRGMQVDRVRETHIEGGRKDQLLADADA